MSCSMRCTPSIKELAAALAKAQGEIRNAKKDSDNPYFKSTYADLASVVDACRAALSKNGIAVVQSPRAAEEGGIEVETLLAHSSGEWIADTLRLPVTKSDAQGLGSAITYARRYALAAMVGVAPEDDDGNAAVDSIKGIKEKALPSLKAAAAKGIDSLQEAWNGLTKEARQVCQSEMPKLKAQAAEVSNATTRA